MQESPDPEDETPCQSDRLSVLSQEIQILKKSSTNSSSEDSKYATYNPLKHHTTDIVVSNTWNASK